MSWAGMRKTPRSRTGPATTVGTSSIGSARTRSGATSVEAQTGIALALRVPFNVNRVADAPDRTGETATDFPRNRKPPAVFRAWPPSRSLAPDFGGAGSRRRASGAAGNGCRPWLFGTGVGKWRLSRDAGGSVEVRRTTCNRDCPDTCGILAEVEGGRVLRLRGDPAHPVTRGFLCPRTAALPRRQGAADRVPRPRVRDRLDDGFREVSWDEALDLVAGRLARIREESGGASILHYRCGGSLGLLVEVPDLFFSRFGPVTVKAGDVCGGAGDWAQHEDFGVADSGDPDQVLKARTVVLWGKNCATSSPHALARVREARSRGASVVLVDPVRHATVAAADRFLQPRPGGDLALALAAAAVAFREGWTHPDAASWCENLDAFRILTLSRPVADWCAEADVSPADAEDLAWRLGREGPAWIWVGWGLQRHVRGAAALRAIDALALVTGNVGVEGAGVSYYWRRREAFDVSALKGPPPPRTVREACLGEDVLAADAPPIRAAWITAANPVAMLPDSDRVARALRSRELVVVADAWMTDTAHCAHVVLPTRTVLEADDLLGCYGHPWLSAAVPVVPPEGEARSDLEIVQGLAVRLGLGDAFAGTARDWKRRLVAGPLADAGVTLEALEAGAVRNPFAPRVAFEGRRFPTPSGKARLLDSLPGPAPVADPLRPLILMALATPLRQGSQDLEPPVGPPEARVHPASAAGFPDGARARLESRLASLEVVVRHDAGQRRDVVIVPKGGQIQHGQCANRLLPARETDAGGGAAYYDEPVRLVSL